MKKWPHYKLKKMFFISSAFLFTIILFPLACHLVAPAPQYDRPPMIMINESIYQRTGQISQLPPNSIYLGTITSSVSSSESPIENFQANDKLIGDPVYQTEDKKVVINHTNQWWIYCKMD